MTNADKYKTPVERENTFEKFCYEHCCPTCPLSSVVKLSKLSGCAFNWLALEANDEETEGSNNVDIESNNLHVDSNS